MIINISGFGDVEIDDGFVNLSQQEQQKSVQRIVSHLKGRQQQTSIIPDKDNYKNLKSFIGKIESQNDYTVVVGGRKEPDILNKTISQLYNEKGGRLAVGRYQIQMRSAIDVLKENKIDPKNFKFDKKGQDELFIMLAKRRGLEPFIEGKISTENFAKNLSKEWASLPKDKTNKSYYDGIGGNKSLTTWNKTLNILSEYKNIKNANKQEFKGNEQTKNPKLSFESIANKIKKDKTKTPEEKQNILFQTLDVLNAPQYAIANAIYQAYTNEDFELGKSLWEGLTLQEKRSVGDTLSEAIQPETKLGKIAVGTAGFVGDVLTDPLTYTGVGLLAKSGKLTKAGSTAEKMIKAGRAAGKAKETKAVLKFAGAPISKSEIVVDPIARGLTKTGMIVREDLGAISTILSRVGEKISTRMRPKGVDPVEWEKFLIAREKAKNIERSAKLTAIEKAKEIYKSFKDEGLDETQVAKIVDDIEKMQPVTSRGGQIAKETTEEFQKLYQQVGETGKEIIQEQGYKYLPHINVKRNQKIKNAIGYTKKDFSTSSPSDIKRTILKYTDEKGEDFVLSTKTGKVFKEGKQKTILRKKDIDTILSLDNMENFAKKIGYEFNQTIKNQKFSDVPVKISNLPFETSVRKGIINVSEAKEVFKNTEIPELIKIAQLSELSKMYKKNPNVIRDLLVKENLLYKKTTKESPYKKFKGKTTFNKKLIDQENILNVLEDSGIENMLNKYQSTLLKKPKEKNKKINLGSGDVNIFKLLDVDKTLTNLIKKAEKLGLNKVLNEIEEVNSPKLVDLIGKKVENYRSIYGSIKQASISDINKAYGDTVFSTDLPALVAIQGLRTAKVIGGDEFFKQAKKLSSKTQKKVNGVDYIESNAPELAGQYFHPEIVKHIDSTKKSLIDEDSPLKLLRELTNVWKASATLWAPSFHTRNAMSNIWQNSLAGVTNPIDFSKALVITKKMKSNSKLTPDELQIVKEYKSQGLEKVGQLSGDIGQSIKNEIMTTMDVLKKRKNPYEVLNKIGGSLGDAIETQAKLHHFISKRKEGLSPFDAGMSVKKYLFDYEDLTKFEKNILKPFLPFYTFTRKNIPIQIETLLKSPARQTKLIKAKNNVEILAGDDETEAILPEWIRNAAPVFVGKKDGKVRYVKLEGFLPTADLNKLSDPGKTLLDMVTPVIKAPVEQITNYNFFFGKKITEKKGLVEGFTGYGEEDLLWYRIPARINHLAGLFRPIREIDKILGTKYKTQNAFEKLSNFLIGGKLYEYDVRELLEQFDYMSESDMRAIKKEINILKQRIQENPEYKDSYIDDIKLLKKSYIKSKRKSIKEKTEARKSLRSGK